MKHLALIMDGNRRWAKSKGWMPWIGHSKGVDAVKRSVEFCIKKQIPHLSLYTFSLENFKRSPEEVKYLFDVLLEETNKNLAELVKQGVRVRFIGDKSLFPTHLVSAIDRLEKASEHCTVLQVILLFCYGAQQEIVHGIKCLVSKIKAGTLAENDISETTFKECLWTGDIPAPDMIIRTGGHQRLSNFLLYQAAYSELLFLDCLWPDLQEEHLEQAVQRFEQSQRNFGQ